MSQKVKSYSVVSLFSGLGGLDLGFIWEGYEIIWANDSSAYATKTYALNFGFQPTCEDLNNISIDCIPDADIIIGGPPCQSFSLMGQRDPKDPRGSLVFQFLEVVKRKQPKAFVIENVSGMNASFINGIRLPNYLKEAFIEQGYYVRLMKLLAIDYLVPQRRERVVLVGCSNVMPSVPDAYLFAKECYGIDLTGFRLNSRDAIGDLGPCTIKNKRASYKLIEPSLFAKIMRSKGLPDVSLHECPRMSKTDQLIVQYIPPGGNYKDIPDEIAPGRVLKYKQTGGRTTTYGRLHPDKPAYTINTYFRRPNVGCNFHYSEPRLITPREAMRFQSIPDHFELVYSSQDGRNALIGNAVPPLMARALAWSLKNDLSKTSCDVNNSYNKLKQLSIFA